MTQVSGNDRSPLRLATFASGLAWAVCVVVLTAIAVRGWLFFGTPLVPGMNGGYYLVQTRALLSARTLGVPDFPLTFALQAALAKIARPPAFVYQNKPGDADNDRP